MLFGGEGTMRVCRVFAAGGVLVLALTGCGSGSAEDGSRSGGEAPLAAVDPGAPGSPGLVARFEEELVRPPTTGVIDLGQRDVRDAVVGVSCETCHEPGRQSSIASRGATALEVHGVVDLEHGAGRLRCASCHDPEDRARLRLADGRTLRMGEVVSLCGQCHGTQLRDFEHGAHGGARGYWDLSRGPRYRNACTTCHAPHSPAYPLVTPAPPPNDRFLPAADAGDHS